MKHALVTGGTGFIGQHLVRKLVAGGFKTTALVRPSSDISSLLGLGRDVQIVELNQSFESIKRCFNENSFDAVFHLATHFAAEHDPAQIDELVNSNITFGMKVAEAAASNKVENFINVGTNWQYYHSASYRPLNLYASLKQAFEDILLYYSDAKGLKVANVILFDTYGDNDNRQKLIPLLLANKLGDKPIKLSPGEQLMDLTHVDKVVSTLLLANEKLTNGSERFIRFIVSAAKAKKLRDVVSDFCEEHQLSANIQWGARDYREREVFDILIYDRFENLASQVD